MKLDRLVNLLLISCLMPTLQPSGILAADRNLPSVDRIAQGDAANPAYTPKEVQDIAQKITVRVTAANGNNGGSGVLIAKKGTTYLVMTNRHVAGRATQFQIQTPDGQKHTAKPVPNTGFNAKYDIALLQFTSNQKYQLANLDNGSRLAQDTAIYSVGYPYDSNKTRISVGKVTQLSDVPLDDGTQIGYKIDKNSADIKQGMSGGPIVDERGVLLGINTIGSYPILPSYTYFDGSKPIAKLAARYRQANWGVPVYNLLTQLDANILYGYDNFPKVQRQVTPTGYMAKLNRETRQQTVRIEDSAGNGSGVIVAKQGNTYYVLTAKHVLETPPTDKQPKQRHSGIKVITHNQESYQIQPSDIKLAEGVDLAVVKFTSTNSYPVAKIGNYSPTGKATVFVAGYPGREKIDSPLWQWQLNPGTIEDKEMGKLLTQNKGSFTNGYDLIYSSISYGGMSGGPVFDTEGRVIGIHGKAEGTTNEILGKSLGISIQTFIESIDRLKVPNLLKISNTLPVDLNQADRDSVIAVRDNIARPNAESTGGQWLQYGNQLYRTEKYSEAILAFDRAIERGREYQVQGNYGKGLVLMYSGDLTKALNVFSLAISATSPSARKNYYYLWKYKSYVLMELNKCDEALETVKEAIALERSYNRENKLEPNDMVLTIIKAEIYVVKTQYREAIAVYDSLISEYPQEAYGYYGRGLAKVYVEEHDSAINDFNRAIAINPKFSLAYIGRAGANAFLKKFKSVIDDSDLVISINPKSPEAYFFRGVGKYTLGKKKEALVDLEMAIANYDRVTEIAPRLYASYFIRGNAKFVLGKKKEALADFDRAIEINPYYAALYFNRGQFKVNFLAIANSNLDKRAAIADYDRAIAINPLYADAYYSRGSIKYDLEDKKSALVDLTKAAELFLQQKRMSRYQKTIESIKSIKKK